MCHHRDVPAHTPRQPQTSGFSLLPWCGHSTTWTRFVARSELGILVGALLARGGCLPCKRLSLVPGVETETTAKSQELSKITSEEFG